LHCNLLVALITCNSLVAFRLYFNDADERLPEPLLEIPDPGDSCLVDYITCSKLLTLHDLPGIVKGCHEAGPLMEAKLPTEEEVKLLEKMHARESTCPC
jgi:hypothetical protein